MRIWQSLLAVLAAAAIPAAAHHSFAVYFDSEKPVSIRGTVTQFRFTNPHGLIVVNARDQDGATQSWRAETNAPVVLQRRGWTRSTLRPGQVVTLDGWQARDGSRYMRLREVRDEDGRLIGSRPFGQNDG